MEKGVERKGIEMEKMGGEERGREKRNSNISAKFTPAAAVIVIRQ